MNKKLYVGNLNYSTADEELRGAFAPFGTLASVAVVVDRVTGQHRGFGFVEYERAADAQRAIDSLNGQQLGGHALAVNEARERDPKPRFSEGRDSAFEARGQSKPSGGMR